MVNHLEPFLFDTRTMCGVLRMSIFSFMLAISTIIFLTSSYSTASVHKKYAEQWPRSHDLTIKKFREERNWWLSLFALTLWLVLWRVHGLLTRLTAVEEELSQMRRSQPRPAMRQGGGIEDSSSDDDAPKKTHTPTAPVLAESEGLRKRK
ncbi:hypothetical protein EON66_11465 [archaeon]|nr:MAG: hypothetical protein EON66_11465 [archaeon]